MRMNRPPRKREGLPIAASRPRGSDGEVFGLGLCSACRVYLDGAGHFAEVAAVESVVTVMLQEAAKPVRGKFNWRGFWLDWDEWSDAHREIVGAFVCGSEFFSG